MKHFILLTTLLFSSLFHIQLSAQQSVLTGFVVDSLEAPLPGATVTLINQNDSTIQKGTTTDAKGYFEVNLKAGYYDLNVSYIGFHKATKTILIEYEKVNAGNILLKENSIALSEFTVVGKVLPVIMKGDTTEINARAYKSNPDADASDIIEKMPTVSMNEGMIQAEGEEVKKVLVDGKPFFGNDPNTALKSLPAEVIDKIQIFDDQSDQSKLTGFDDGNSEKTLNIITKKEFRNGTFGHVSGGYGTDDRYRVNGLLNYFKDDQRLTIIGQSNNINQQNFSTADLAGVASGASGGNRGGRRGPPGRNVNISGDANDFLIGEQDGLVDTDAFGINYTDKFGEKLEMNASYFFNRTENNSISALERNYFGSDLNQQYFENETATSTNENHRFNMRMKYDVDASNAIIMTPSLTLQRYNGESNLNSLSLLENAQITGLSSTYTSELLTYTFENKLLFQHKFAKRGRTLSLRLLQSYNPNNAESEAISFDEEALPGQNIDQRSDLDQIDQSYKARLIYTEPLSRKVMMRFNYSPSIDLGESEKFTYVNDTLTNEYNILDPNLSNSFESEYMVQEGGGGFMYRIGRGSMLMFNANYQFATLKTEQNFPNTVSTSRDYSALLPMMMWRYKFSANSNLRMMFRTSTTVPEVSDLQGVLDNSNPLQLSIGNPTLDQQYQYQLFAKYNLGKPESASTFFAMIRGNMINNYIGTNTTIANGPIQVDGIQLTPGAQLSMPVNLNGYYNLNFFSTYGFPLTKLKSNLNINLSAQYSRIPGIINNEENITNNPNFGLGGVLSSNISEKLDFTLSSNSTMNYSLSSLAEEQNTEFFQQSSTVKFYWKAWKGLVLRTSLNHQYYAGLSESFDDNFILWGMGLGYKFMKNDRAELGIEAFDLLDQNQNLSRITTETYYEDSETNTLRQYVLLTFRYNFGKYNLSKNTNQPKEEHPFERRN